METTIFWFRVWVLGLVEEFVGAKGRATVVRTEFWVYVFFFMA